MSTTDNTMSSNAANNAAPVSSMASLAAVTAAAASPSGIPSDIDLTPLLSNMFDKLSRYANGELAASAEEYELLEKLNKHAAKKYEHMADHAIKLVSAISTVNATHASLESFFTQIDELEANLIELETVVNELDLYSKRLQYTFQQVYK